MITGALFCRYSYTYLMLKLLCYYIHSMYYGLAYICEGISPLCMYVHHSVPVPSGLGCYRKEGAVAPHGAHGLAQPGCDHPLPGSAARGDREALATVASVGQG